MEYVVQRLEMGDVVLIDLPEQGGEIEAKVVEPIDRTKTSVRVSLRVAGREDFVKEWPAQERDQLWPVITATYAGYARYQDRTRRGPVCSRAANDVQTNQTEASASAGRADTNQPFRQDVTAQDVTRRPW